MSEKEPPKDHPILQQQPLLGPSSTLFKHSSHYPSEQVHREFSRWTVYDPRLARFIFFSSVVQLACGFIRVEQLGSNLSVPMLIHLLPLPWCSLTHVLPLSRNNQPKVVMISSSIFFILYLASTLLSVGACVGSGKGVPHGLRRAECPVGVSGVPGNGVTKGVWYTLLAFQECSIVAYGIYGVMAWKVHRAVLKERKESSRCVEKATDLETGIYRTEDKSVYMMTTVYIFARDEARDKLGTSYGGFSSKSRLY